MALDSTVAGVTANSLVRGSSAVLACHSCGTPVKRNASTMRRQRGVFCSIVCYRQSQFGRPAHNRGRRIVALKACANCGDAFAPSKPRRKFCSQRCAGAFYSASAHPGWRGGITPARKQLFNTSEYRVWRQAVLERDRGRCRWCESEGVVTYRPLEIHHIVPVSADVALVFAVTNGIALCKPHHDVTRGVEDIYARQLAQLIDAPLVTRPASSLATRRRLVALRAA
jgi:hypothetical protein